MIGFTLALIAVLAWIGYESRHILFAPPILTPEKSPLVLVGKPGGTKKIGVPSLPETYNPVLANDSSSSRILGQMYLGLVYTHPLSSQIQPDLAERWEISPDKRTYTLHLRPYLKWSDGRPLTADDVVFTYNELINHPKIPNNYRAGLLVNGYFPVMKKQDALTVSFQLDAPFVPFLMGLSAPILPKHVFEPALQPNAQGKIPLLTFWSKDHPPQAPVVSGPWQLATVSPEQVELVKNPHYYHRDQAGKPLPYLDKLVYFVYFDHFDWFNQFNQGQVDAVSFVGNRYDWLKRKDIKIYNLGPDTSASFVMFNQSLAHDLQNQPVVEPFKSAWFRNQKFRQALAYAINDAEVITKLYLGDGVESHSIIPEQSPFYHPCVRKYPHDLEKARTLLKEAHFQTNQQRQLIDADGHPVVFDLWSIEKLPLETALAHFLKGYWQELGIQVNLRSMSAVESNQLINETLKWDAMLMRTTRGVVEPHFGINVWRPEGQLHLFNMGHSTYWKGKKTTQYANWETEILSLYEQAAQEFDFVKRKALYARAQDLAAESLPYILMSSPNMKLATSDRLLNVFPMAYPLSHTDSVDWNNEYQFLE
ncbi:MAG: ABC transporter substrate-binding protein [Candidatus Sericytochromatia bacterium]